jgi:hypothetical protein
LLLPADDTYHQGVEQQRARQRVMDVVTAARIAGLGEEEISLLVRAGLDIANKCREAQRAINWDELPTIGSIAA